jgi:IclR family acetate operon transcriptional repressor
MKTTESATNSLARGLLVLEVISAEQPIGVGELARTTGLPKSSVQRALGTLADAGWIESTDDRLTRWSLSQKVRSIGHRAGDDPSLHHAALPHLHWLRDQTQETIHFGMSVRDRSMLVIDRVDSNRPVRTFMEIGTTIPLHACASGKAVLASWDERRLDRYIEAGLDEITPTTITAAEDLRRDLKEAREKGYAVNFAENREGVFAVGAAGSVQRDGAGAAISISMPDSRFDASRVTEWGELARETAARIDASLR